MALLYDPGTFMPRHHDEFSWMSWMMTWPTGPWHLHDLMPGGTVYLVRAGSTQRIMWETTVVRSFAVPYEAVGSLAAEVWLRWGLTIDTRNLNAGGFCIGWQAEPVALLDRGPIEAADSTADVAADAGRTAARPAARGVGRDPGAVRGGAARRGERGRARAE